MALNPNIILSGNPVPDPVQNYAKILQLRNLQAQQPLIQQQIAAGQQEAQQRALQIQQQQQGIADDQAGRKLFAQGALPTQEQILSTLGPVKGGAVLKSITDGNKAKADLLKSITTQKEQFSNYLGHRAFALQQAGLNDSNVGMAVQDLSQVDPNLAKRISDVWQQGGEQALAPLLQQAIAGSKEVQGQIAASRKNEEAARHNKQTEQQAVNALEQAKNRDTETAAYHQGEVANRKEQLAIDRARLEVSQAADAAGASLIPEAKEQAARVYLKTGIPPTFGIGKQGAKLKVDVLNRAAEIDKDADIAANKGIYAADTGSLKSIQKNLDNVTAFESTAVKNLDTFLDTAKKVVDSGSPFLNMPLRKISGSVGSANQAAFDAARTTALTEIAKVLSSSNATGVLSDSARKEVSDLTGPNATLKQIYAAANILKRDMANRRTSYEQQISDIKGRIGGKNTPEQGGAPKATHRYNPATGKIEAIQ